MLRTGGDGFHVHHRVMLVLGEPLLVGKRPEWLAAAGVGRLELRCTPRLRSRSGAYSWSYLRF